MSVAPWSGIETGAGADVVGIGPGEREMPAKSTDARFWLFENLPRECGGEEEKVRREPRAYGSPEDEHRSVR